MDQKEFYRNWGNIRSGLRGDGEYTVKHRNESGTMVLRKGLDGELLSRVVNEHCQIRDNSPEALLKRSKKRCVSKSVIEGRPFLVKEFCSPGPWGRFAADSRAWVSNWGLELCNIAVPQPLGWLKGKGKQRYLIFEFVHGLGAYSFYKAHADNKDRCEWLSEEIYRLVCQLYDHRIVHCDLKLANLIVDDDKVWLIDNDAVRFDVKINEKDWLRNLRHLTGGMPDPIYVTLYEFLNNHPRPY